MIKLSNPFSVSLVISATLLFILFRGEPDLIGAVIKILMEK